MNKNSENYKSTYSQLRPSDEAVERAMDIANEKKRSFKPIFKRLAAAALAFAVLIGGGFGINYSLQKDDSSGELGVLIAYAATGEFLEVGSITNQDFFYAIYVAPFDNEEVLKTAIERYNFDLEKVTEKMYELSDEGYSANIRHGNRFGDIYTIEAGQFVLNLNDYSEVKSFKVENSSIYGELEFDYDFWGRLGYTDTLPTDFDDDEFLEYVANNYPWPYNGHEFTISGEVLRRSQESGFYSAGTKHEVNKGYRLSWEISEELAIAIDNDPSFDLSQIKDTITFIVEFNDGSVKTASLDLYFDSDGYMHFGK